MFVKSVHIPVIIKPKNYEGGNEQQVIEFIFLTHRGNLLVSSLIVNFHHSQRTINNLILGFLVLLCIKYYPTRDL